MSKITYGEGKINIEPTGTGIKGFDIIYTGSIHANIILDDQWHVIGVKNRWIGFTVGDAIVEPIDIAEYSGEITIKDCSLSDGHSLFQCEVINPYPDNLFEHAVKQFDSSTEKLSELKEVVGTPSRKRLNTDVKHTNLFARENEYFYLDGSPVKEGTKYQINLHPRKAMIGKVTIFQKLPNGKFLDFKKVKRPKRRPILKKHLKTYVQRLKRTSDQNDQRGGKDTENQEGTSYGG